MIVDHEKGTVAAGFSSFISKAAYGSMVLTKGDSMTWLLKVIAFPENTKALDIVIGIIEGVTVDEQDETHPSKRIGLFFLSQKLKGLGYISKIG